MTQAQFVANFVSSVAVGVQGGGTVLLALTVGYLARLFGRSYARLWAWGFGAQFLALAGLRLAIGLQNRFYWTVFLVGEWGFLVLLAAGCRLLVRGGSFRRRVFFAALPIATLCALSLVPLPRTFNSLFAGQAVVVAGMAGVAFWEVGRVPKADRTAGWQLMRAALAVMTVLFSAYVPLYLFIEELGLGNVLAYSSFADLLAQVFLGFGMVLVLSEKAQHDLVASIVKLQDAQRQLEHQARIDPLTEVFNRHAFNSLVAGRKGLDSVAQVFHGTVVMVDVDHLKKINDEHGHEAGDVAIRVAAATIRGLIRPEDLLFRWGGDEFLVILPTVPRDKAIERFGQLDSGIPFLKTDGNGGPKAVLQLSWGAADFGDTASLANAIAEADRLMYRQRARARSIE